MAHPPIRYTFTRLAIVYGTALLALAVVPRFAVLGERPPMHDEAQFAYYAYDYMVDGHYAHDPIMHGPALMIIVGTLYRWLGDTVTVGRIYVAVCSLVMLALALVFMPRRTRWWVAPLLIASPVLLYYSRFLRNEIPFHMVTLVGMLGFVWSVDRRRLRAVWAAVGPAAWLFLLADKINALFVLATGLTFLGVYWAVWLARAHYPDRNHIHRESGAAVTRARGTKGKGGGGGQPPAPGRAARFWRSRRPVHWRDWVTPALGWAAGTAIGVLLVLLIYGTTTVHGGFAPWGNIVKTWNYWAGAQAQHRIEGPLHYYFPILLVYELPLLLFVAAGLARDACRTWRRLAVYGGALGAWLLVWLLWASLPLPGIAVRLTGFLHIQPNGSMLLLGFIITALLVWSVGRLWERRTLAGWIGYWAACSVFQYSSAGEKVPWLAVYLALPFYLMLAWLWAPDMRRWRRPGRVVAGTAVALATALAVWINIPIVGNHSADPAERIVYNHTTVAFDQFCRSYLADWERMANLVPPQQRSVLLQGAPSWPGVWYFRYNHYLLSEPSPMPPTLDLVLCDDTDIRATMEKLPARDWTLTSLSLRDAWLAPGPDEDREYLELQAAARAGRRTARALGGKARRGPGARRQRHAPASGRPPSLDEDLHPAGRFGQMAGQLLELLLETPDLDADRGV